jgi:hypothetical protein
VTDVAIVTSLRDGMNLVSYEYVACQSDNAGVLVLSEFAGAAQSLGAGAILVNPWNISDMAQVGWGRGRGRGWLGAWLIGRGGSGPWGSRPALAAVLGGSGGRKAGLLGR